MVKGGHNTYKVKIWTRLVSTVCIIVMIVCVVIIVLPGAAIRSCIGDSDNGNSTASTAKREALPPGSVNETDYFTEDNEYMKDPILIEEGLKHFYKLTGVQPYLHFETSTDFIFNYDYHDLNIYRNLVAYTRYLYSKLFTDESHLLVVAYADYNSDAGRYEISLCTMVGSKARTVIDGESEKILTDRIKFYFKQARWPSEELFSNAFSDAADRIMGVAPPQSNKTVWIILGVLAGLVLLVWLRIMRKKKKLKAKQDMEMLKKPLEQFGADTGNEAEMPRDYDVPPDEAEILAKKYVRNRTASAGVKPQTKGTPQ